MIDNVDEPWPSEYEQPTIIVSGVPAHSIGGVPAPNLTIPISWMQSVNGGVVVEVSRLVSPTHFRVNPLRSALINHA